MTMTDYSESDLEELIATTLDDVGVLLLSVDEVTTVLHDLGFTNDPVAEIGTGFVHSDTSRRSLLARELAVKQDDGLMLQPWLTLMADTVGDPLLSIRMRRDSPEGNFAWTLFVNSRIGVQQQVSADGFVAWSPFAVEGLVELVIGALHLDPEGHDADPVSFDTTLGWLHDADADDVDHTVTISPEEGRYLSAKSSFRGSSMCAVTDRTVEPPQAGDLTWLDFGSKGTWRLEIANEAAELERTSVKVACVPTADLLDALLALLPLDETIA